MIIDALEDYPGDLLPLSETRECAKCGAYTWWANKRQRTKGTCISCVKNYLATEDLHDRVRWNIARVFPGTTVVEKGPPKRWAAGVYAGAGEGPCALCGGRIRRYGDEGIPLCAECARLQTRGVRDGGQ